VYDRLDDIVAEESVKPTPEGIEKVPGLRDYKNMMRQFFTVRRQTVKDCGHKYNEMSEPRTNCHVCWFAWLNAHGDMIKICDELFTKPGGEAALVQVKGRKFVQNFKKFMSTLARWKAEEAIKKGLNEQRDSSSAIVGAEEQGQPVQESTGVGEDSQREAEDNNVAS
jgi:hypothetical protein